MTTLYEVIERFENNAEFERRNYNLQGCLDFRQFAEWLKDYKRLKEQEPCDDAVSRQAVLDGVDRYIAKAQSTCTVDDFYSFAELVVKALPSVRPQESEPKTGQWKRISMDRYTTHAQYWYECDKCGEHNLGNTDFCPYCGCRMVEPKESETWHGIHAQITAPKGTFERIFNEADDDYDI